MKKIILIASLLMLAACGMETPKRSSLPEVIAPEDVSADQIHRDLTPKLDILMVVDDSRSMRKHQDDVAAYINQFVSTFSERSVIDFHIGITVVADQNPAHKGINDRHPIGELIPLQDPTKGDDEHIPLLVNGAAPARFVTRDTPNLVEVLKKTIRIGEDPAGDFFEESFSPVEEALLNPAVANGANAGFLRPNAYLLVMFLTDANDSSLNPGARQLYSEVKALKGGDRNKVYFMALVPPTVGGGCQRDAAGPAYKINTVIQLAGDHGKWLSLCSGASEFQKEFKDFGSKLTEKVGRQVIQLSAPPDITKIKVTYGSQDIPVDYEHGWTIDPTNNRVYISATLNVKPEPGAKLDVHAFPVPPSHFQNGQAVPVSTDATPLAASVVNTGPGTPAFEASKTDKR